MQNNVGLIITKRAELHPDMEAVIDVTSGGRQTYAELNGRCNQIANGLTSGGVVSSTSTTKPPLLVLPEKSVAVQLTVVLPMLKVEPLTGEQETTGLASVVSVTGASNQVTVAPVLPSASFTISGTPGEPGLPNSVGWVGGVVSSTLTVLVTLAALPDESET